MTALFDLSSLRLHPQAERELRWYFTQAEGALGLHSNHEAVVNACLGGRNKGSKPVGAARAVSYNQHQLDAADDARRVARRLSAVSARDRRTLQAAYGGLSLPRRTLADWLALAPLGVAASLLYVAARRRGVTLAQVRGKDEGGKAVLAKLVGQARADLAVAGAAYEGAR
jgi:hypothetical protein